MNQSLTAPTNRKLWMPRTHLSEGVSALSQDLQHHGIEVLEQGLNTLRRFSHLEVAPDFSASWWLFTSAIAVAFWADYLKEQGQDAYTATVKIACVGEATAKAVQHHFKRPATFVPEYAQDATRFAEAFNQHQAKATTCLWVSSALADDTFAHVLQAEGHQVQHLPFYEPVALDALALERLIEEAVSFSPDIVLLTSPSNIRILADSGAFERVQPQQWICLGKRTLEAVKDLGLTIPVEVLPFPTASAILQSLIFPS